ncbi:MAG: ATP-binding cassette domain-containing protein, partial [Rhodocyclaceae bacterium]
MTTTPVIRIRDLCTRFGDIWIHRQLDLEIQRGELVSLVGGSGSGKTTLLRMVVG